MATQAKITFTALNTDSDLSERTLTLTPNLRTIKIGRASKTPSKGLQAAVDNAWFDSPVMSRDHAEISLDIESKVITLQDIGSMHGTFVNCSQLIPKEPHKLSNNDLVVFGVEVKRNLDTFPSCAFSINYELLPFKTDCSYAFPDSDGEEEYEISDDEGHEERSSEDGVSIESPKPKLSQAIDAIDLTRDGSPEVSELHATAETSVEKNVMYRPAFNPYADDANSSSDSDDQSEIEYGDGNSSDGRNMDELKEQELQDSEVEEDIVDDTDEEEKLSSQSRDFSDNGSKEASGTADIGLGTTLDQPSVDSNIRSSFEAVKSFTEEEDHDDESDFGLSNAGVEEIRALFDEGLINNAGDNVFIGDESDSGRVVDGEAHDKSAMVDEKVVTPKHVTTFARLSSEESPVLITDYLHNSLEQTAVAESTSSHPVMNFGRLPSPSDAAMVKTATPSNHFKGPSNPVLGASSLRPNYPKLTIKSLGDKTGKHAFFAAREDNRAKIYGGNLPARSSLSAMAKTADEKRDLSPIHAPKFRLRKPQGIEQDTPNLPELNAVNSTIHSFCGPSYLHDHTQTLRPIIRRPSPEPDMGSAVTYNESKASMASANAHTVSPIGRLRLTINDIIEDADTSNTLKRKAGDISDAIEEEARIWASSSTIDNLGGSVTIPAPAPEATLIKEQPENSPVPVTETSEHRPAKRLRKIVESVGYIALGGATLFGALVLSAPDFL